ncbi:Riboflavin biosynthesis protein RibF [Aquicella siphonis]|uniref:Riboflavin biosynthesis protein n=1 Tax=Aquicella siphonis TaxID=254247 RepID=A0A5E4PI60_9COXI|nr:bifunctional riboflavin kinase/FAD synthetase [Aquicella siphonis]VVC76245.1 Riboflavin biosynthesis protein RibF [Aquicella siphonis]
MPAKLIRSYYNMTPRQQGGVVTIGNFDGVHLGHQQLLARTTEEAAARHVPSVAVTFEPHAFEYFSGQNVTIPRLTRLREKYCALAECGVENILILRFNHQLAELSAPDFVSRIIAGSLRPCHVIVGDDFHFGRGRQGDFALLESMGRERGFSVETVPTFTVGGERVSSTRVRSALAAGDHALVRALLGRPYSMLGRVRRGDQRGRQFGFPTANIYLHRKLTPVRGVYCVFMHGIAATPLPGVANVGVRPSVDGTRTLLEVHLLDFNQDIYGRYVEVEFCEKLREEVRFSSLDLLKTQIAQDVAAARNYFKQRGVI